MLRETDPRFAHLERKVGLFVVAALAVAALVIGAAALRQGIFTPRTTVYFLDESGKDLSEGLAVEIRGFTIGSVTGVSLTDDGLVRVALSIDDSHMKWIRRDSTARLTKEFFIGEGRIEISPGSADEPPVEPGGTIAFEREQELGEVAKNVMDEVKPVLLDIKQLIAYIDDPEGDFKTSIANFNRLSAELMETKERIEEFTGEAGENLAVLLDRVDAMATSLQEELLPEVRDLVGRSRRAVENADGTVGTVESFVAEDLRAITESLRTEVIPELRSLVAAAGERVDDTGVIMQRVDSELPGLLEKVDAGLSNIIALTEDLRGAAAQVPEMTEEGRALMEESRALIEGTRKLWPFSGRVRGPEEQQLGADSYAPP